jgi:NDP-sugar pyrophosphorylase family protein
MIDFHDHAGARATISLTEVEDPSAFGVVPTRPDGAVVGFIEKPPRELAPTNWINAGTYVLESDVLRTIPERMNVSIERETFPRMVASSSALYAYKSDAYWLDMGTPEKYLDAHRDVLAGRLGGPPAPDASQHDGRVFTQGESHVADSARVDGPALIGAATEVAANSLVAQSSLGDHVAVGEHASVIRSVILTGARVEDGATISDSVVGPEAVIGRGTTLDAITVIGAGVAVAPRTRMSAGRAPA